MPWGGARGEEAITSTDYGYTGQMREGDIYYYGARYYDPAIGRFMQADTIVPLQVQGTQAFDRYAYVNNNPLRYTDPTGHGINNTNTMMTDTGSFKRELTYEQLISNVFGVVLNPKTEFSQTQKQTVYSALITMASSASNNYGLNGTRWVRGFASGTMISNGGLVSRKLNAYVTLPGEIQMHAGFTENDMNTLIHEFGHILDNKSAWHGLGTYIGGGYSAELAKQAHVSQIRLLRFDHGYPEESAAYFFDDVIKFSKPHLYGNYSIADYFAEGFMAMIVNPSDPMLPTVVQEYFIDLFGGVR